MSDQFAHIKAAVVDGRAHTIFHRQTQLEKLHEQLRLEAIVLQDAIAEDSGVTRAEAAIEYYATMKCVKDAYHSLKPVTLLAEEYSIVAGKDAPLHREPVGLVYIEPQLHTQLYSLVSPLCSAIAAGNCVIVLLESNLRRSNALLQRILVSALEQDTLSITNTPVTSGLLEDQTIFVLQNTRGEQSQWNRLFSTGSPCLAFVDRTADLKLAAKELVTARFAFGGRSPYAPDLVLVNEFVRDEFLHEVVQECVGYGTSAVPHVNGNIGKKSPPSDDITQGIDRLRKRNSTLRTIVQGATHAVVEITSRNDLLSARLDAPILCVHAVRSLDDGIDLVSQSTSPTCTAAYHFGKPEYAKYLCQFVNSTVSVVNYVPRELLVGPAAPPHRSVSLGNRYPAELFTLQRPQFVNSTAETQRLTKIFEARDDSVAGQLMAEAMEPLVVKGRHSGAGIGFFETGILLNGSLILIGGLSTIVAVAYITYTRYFHR